MARFGTIVGRLTMVAVPAALGVAAVLYAGELRSLPDRSAASRPATPVRTITLAPVDLRPRVTGYGTVEPVHEWRAVARVEGEIAEIAPGLAPGVIVDEGRQLFRIDDSDLKLQLASIDAQIAASKVKDGTVQASLAIARSELEVAQADLARQTQLQGQGRVTQTQLDASQRQELNARAKVTDLESQLKLNAAEREVLATQRATVERAIGFAVIEAPFQLRVNGLEADLGQYVNRGQVLLTGEGTDAVDISAQFPIGRIGPMLRLVGAGTQVTDLKARVSLPQAGHPVFWPARVERMGDAIDETTQSAPVVVRVEDPLGQAKAGERPPLRRTMVVMVELLAPGQKALVVPAEAVAGGTALVVSEEGTLVRKPVTVGFVTGDIAVVTKGLAEGEQLVIADPSIAVPGMAVKPVEDEARRAQVAAEAAGRTADAPQPGSGMGGGGGGGGKKAQEAEK